MNLLLVADCFNMRAALTLVFVLNAQPAFARCHSIWHYPWKQNCQAATPHRTWIAEAPAAPAAVIPDIDPILIPPGWDEEQDRAKALRQAEHQLELHKEENQHGD